MYFLLYGQDTYRSKKQLNKFIAEFKARRDPQGYNTVILDGAAVTADEILCQCMTAPFLGEKRLVVVKYISDNSDTQTLDRLYSTLKTNTLPNYAVLVFWEAKEFTKSAHELFGALTKQRYSQEFSPLSGAQLIKWVCVAAEQGGVRFDSAAASQLVEVIGADLGQIELELQKIAAWGRSEGKKLITKQDVRAMLPPALDDEVFHFIDALFQGRTSDALRLLYDQRASGAREQELFGALQWQIRTLLEIKDFIMRNPSLSSADVARALGIHPYVIKKTSALLPRVSMKLLSELHTSILQADIEIKTGERSEESAFDQLAIGIVQKIKNPPY